MRSAISNGSLLCCISDTIASRGSRTVITIAAACWPRSSAISLPWVFTTSVWPGIAGSRSAKSRKIPRGGSAGAAATAMRCTTLKVQVDAEENMPRHQNIPSSRRC